jgi:hypothetical protein
MGFASIKSGNHPAAPTHIASMSAPEVIEMNRTTRLALAGIFHLSICFIGSTPADALFDCSSEPGTSATEESAPEADEEPLVYGSDSIDIITINPEVAVAFQDEGDADTEGDGTSASAGESGAADGDSDEGPQSCLLRTHDAIDVLTVNPEASVSVDDDLILDGSGSEEPAGRR